METIEDFMTILVNSPLSELSLFGNIEILLDQLQFINSLMSVKVDSDNTLSIVKSLFLTYEESIISEFRHKRKLFSLIEHSILSEQHLQTLLYVDQILNELTRIDSTQSILYKKCMLLELRILFINNKKNNKLFTN